MVDIFTKTDFENALPVSRKSSVETKLWKPLGLIGGEFCYLVPVREQIAIMVRSSVRADGKSAATGEDSIRCWIVSTVDYKPWGSKISRWVTRVPGWEKRLTCTLRQLYKMALSIDRCPHCAGQMKVFKVKREGPTHGRIFIKCNCERGQKEPPKFMEIS